MRLILLVAVLAPFVELSARVTADPNVSRNSLVRLPIKKHVNVNHLGSSNHAQRDLIRSRNLVERIQRRDSSTFEGTINAPLTVNLSEGVYSASIGLGSPPTSYNLIVDTGSSFTWVGGSKPYIATNTSVKTCNTVNITYGIGQMIGTEYIDSVTIAPRVVISRQSIGVASNSAGFPTYDGILGLGPDDLTRYMLRPNNTNVIPTVTDNLFEQGMIGQKLIAVSFEPTTSLSARNGELTFGGVDDTKFTGEITYVPITTAPLSKFYWGINASLQYGNGDGPVTILNTTAGVVDTGTTFLGLAEDAYNLYQEATGAVYDNSTGLLRITKEQYKNVKSLFFVIGGTRFELIPDAQIAGTQDGFIYLVVIDLASITKGHPGTLDFIMGMVVLERFYSVFDTTNNRVGLAKTQFTDAIINS